MKHIEYWKSFDGREFSNETECIEHELKYKLFFSKIQVINPETGEPYRKDSIINQEVYNNCEAVIVKNNEDLELLRDVQFYTGFYDGIDAIGKWKYDNNENKWVKEVAA